MGCASSVVLMNRHFSIDPNFTISVTGSSYPLLLMRTPATVLAIHSSDNTKSLVAMDAVSSSLVKATSGRLKVFRQEPEGKRHAKLHELVECRMGHAHHVPAREGRRGVVGKVTVCLGARKNRR